MDTRKHWYGWLSVGATAATIAAGVAIYSAGPATADCGTLHIRDDAHVLDANTMQNAANVCPQVPALAWTTNKDADNETAFTNDVKALVGPTYPMVIGRNANSNYTSVQVDPNAAGITQNQANAAETYATTMFNSTYFNNRGNSTNAMLAAVRSLNSSIAADHGQSGMIAPAPGTAPSIAPPAVSAPSTNNGLTGWEIFWCVVGPLLVLAALGLLLWRFLAGRGHRYVEPEPTPQTYTRPVTRTATTTTTAAGTAEMAGRTRDVRRRATPTTPVPPVRTDATAVRPATTGEPVRDVPHGESLVGESLVSYEVREADGSRQEFHYVDPESRSSAGGEWVDQRGVSEADNNQSWWRPGVKDTGDR
jgi:hypothetical protein